MVKEQKNKLRKNIKQLKKTFPEGESRKETIRIFEQLEQHKAFIESKIILAYWSMPDEVPTHDFLLKWYKTKKILLPCIEGDDLILREFSGIKSLVKSDHFNVLEPKGTIFSNTQNIDIMIIPGVAFDKNNNRLGRGKGFYDRLLKTSTATKIGIAFSFQMHETIPVEKHDIALDMVLSAK